MRLFFKVPADASKLEAEVERLVQRLVAGVGNLDRRFASLFLVSLNERRRIKVSSEFELKLHRGRLALIGSRVRFPVVAITSIIVSSNFDCERAIVSMM